MPRNKSVLRRRKADKSTGNQNVTNSYPKDEYKIFSRVTVVIVLLTIILLGTIGYGLLNSQLSSVSIYDMHDMNASWVQASNSELRRGERLLEDLPAPESIAFDSKGNIYTGLLDGRLVKISNIGHTNLTVTNLAESIQYSGEGQRKGKRIFGIRLHDGKLYFADAFQGIFSIDLNTLKWSKIVGYQDVSPELMFPNDLEVNANGNIVYFTDCSEKWTYASAGYSLTEGECTGRVFKVDLASLKVDLLLKNLCFPNGIQLSSDGTKILVSELSRSRIAVFDILSSEKVKTIFLPGGSDNVRPAKRGGYWAPIATWGAPKWYGLERFPMLRNVVAEIINPDLLFYIHILQHAGSGAVVKISDDFDIERIYYDKDGKLCNAISEFHEHDDGDIFVGSYAASGIVKLSWN